MTLHLLATPLAVWEREGLKAALVGAGLPADDVGDPQLAVLAVRDPRGRSGRVRRA